MEFSKLLVGISAVALISGAAVAQTNTSQYSQTGSGNVANVDNTADGNIGNSSTIIQNGLNNSATVLQRGSYNLSFIHQIGNSNEAVHQQSGTANFADSRQSGDYLKSAIAQVGNTNSASVTQSGAHNISTVRQGYAIDASVPSGEFRAADLNAATIDQSGYGLASEVGQRAASATAPAAHQNRASVYQRSSTFSTASQQLSRITQESRGNNAEVFQFEGSEAAPNSSAIIQRNSGATTTTGPSENWASVAQQGAGHTSSVTQDGFRNSSTVRMQGGSSASGAGNQLTLSQTGNDLSGSYRLRPLISGGATGNQASIQQSGNNHSIDVYQFGNSDRTTVSQSNGVNTAPYANGDLPRAQGFISQNAQSSTASLAQSGDNYGEIVQAFGSGSSASISQTDAGDVNGIRARNSAITTQYGTGNSAELAQHAIGASATIWQQVGSSSDSVIIGQGTGGTGLASTTGVAGFTAGPTGAGSSALLADVIQAGSHNLATVYQDGNSLGARVSQYGAGSPSLRNDVFVSQTGSGNSAVAYQGAGVGPSAAGDPASGNSSADNGGSGADEFYFSGGARSAEIRILQTNSGNSASVYQYGRGQLARIEQMGTNNVAGILQQSTATNATAVIRQSGANNSYYVEQLSPGQYIVVTQTGSNNIASNVQRGSTDGSAGFTPPAGFPGP